MERLEGVVEYVIYRNEQNGYSVLEMDIGDELVSVVGGFEPLRAGQRLFLEGQWVDHPQYGRQFQAVKHQEKPPVTLEGLERYLAGAQIQGVGPQTAQRLVEAFGYEVLDVLEHEPEQIETLPGMSQARAQTIAKSYAQGLAARDTLLFLQSHGLGVALSQRVYETYGHQARTVIERDPYRLASDIEGIGFDTADRLALSMGVSRNDAGRLRAGVAYMLDYAMAKGHTCLPWKDALAGGAKLLGAQADALEKAMLRAQALGDVYIEQTPDCAYVYARAAHRAEQDVAARIRGMAAHTGMPQEWEQGMEIVCRRMDIALSSQQREAVAMCMQHRVAIITGGPGTGKTTLIRALVSLLERNGEQIALCAPTGRAAKRMGQAAQREAKTIHRLLEYGMNDEGELAFGYHQERTLPYSAVIVDEMSMVDVFLCSQLLQAVQPGTRLVLVGDTHQLPPVGPGDVLHALIGSRILPVMQLTALYRQAQTSGIVRNAHLILRGEMPELVPAEARIPTAQEEHKQEFVFYPEATGERVAERVLDVVGQMVRQGYDPLEDIQVLAPAKKGHAGVRSLNAQLQRMLNPPAPDKAEKKLGERTLREGDKVMQTQNDYQIEWQRDCEGLIAKGKGIFNGDMGIIERIDAHAQWVSICFDEERRVNLPFARLHQIEHAYCISVHKSQGSEFTAVVLALCADAPMLLQRNLLYTAVTRAREKLIVCGAHETVRQMVENRRAPVRHCGLGRKLLDHPMHE